MASRDYPSPAAASAVRHTGSAAEVVPMPTRHEGSTRAETSDVSAAVGGGTLPVPSFSVHSLHNHVVMATSLPLAGDKSMYALDEQNSTCKAMIPPSSTVSTLKDSATMTTTNEVPN